MGDPGTTGPLVGATIGILGCLLLWWVARASRASWPADLPTYRTVRAGLAVMGGLAVFLLCLTLLRGAGLIGGPG